VDRLAVISVLKDSILKRGRDASNVLKGSIKIRMANHNARCVLKELAVISMLQLVDHVIRMRLSRLKLKLLYVIILYFIILE
jgi:hypothetical protein